MVSNQPLLADLGRRLRRRREEAALSLAETSRRAGVSRRYLTDAEAGRANPSYLVLARLASALDLSLPELVGGEPRPRAGERIALLGLRGAGKSTVGRALALDLEVPFVELDARVEELAGLSLGEIFELHGPDTFRRLEAEALESVLAEGERLVLATGGSLVTHPATYERLRATCRTVWLRASPEEHFHRVLDQGDGRPMQGRPRAMQELRALLDERESLYALCDGSADTSGRSVPEVVAEVRARLGEVGEG